MSGIKRDSTTDPEDIKRIITEYIQQLYTHELDNLNEINYCLKNQKLLQLTKDEII